MIHSTHTGVSTQKWEGEESCSLRPQLVQVYCHGGEWNAGCRAASAQKMVSCQKMASCQNLILFAVGALEILALPLVGEAVEGDFFIERDLCLLLLFVFEAWLLGAARLLGTLFVS